MARQPDGTSAVKVLFGGVDKTGDLAVPSTGGWQTWTDVVKTGVSLPAGQQCLRIAMVGGEFNVNWIEITPAAAPRTVYGNGSPWSIGASGTTRIQAENYDTGGEGVAYHDSDAGNKGGQYRSDGVDIESTTDTGGGYNVGWVAAGEWLEYTVNVAVAGSYDIKPARGPPAGRRRRRVALASAAWTRPARSRCLRPAAGRRGPRSRRPASACRPDDRCCASPWAAASFNLNWIEIGRPIALSVSRRATAAAASSPRRPASTAAATAARSTRSGAVVTLTATPATGSAFAGWGGACSEPGPCTLTMSEARAVTATFDTATTIYGDAIAGDWQSWSWGGPIDFGASSPVKVGTSAINVTYEMGWGGLSLRRTAPLGTSGYAALKFWVYGGTGSDKTLGVTTHAEDTAGESTRVIVTAAANTWTEVTVPLSSLGYPSAIKRVTIMNFTPDPQPTVTFDEIRLEAFPGALSPLTISKAGSGSGSVTSWPPGIRCGSDCSEGYPGDASVTLTPVPAIGSSFSGWSGACTGNGACTVPMSGARSVTATFSGETVQGGVRWMGRVDASNPEAVRFAWQGAGFVATVTGPTVAVKLQTTNAPSAVYQVVVDGLPGARFAVPESAIQTVTLASGLSAGQHVVELYRETEGMYGVSTFWGFAEGTLVGAPALAGRLVEVVGDATSAGYGNLGSEPHPGWVANPSCTWSADNSSWYRTYAALAGHALGAEVSTIARSGWGLVRDGNGNTANTVPSIYANAVGTGDTTPWSFGPQASVVVVNLGTSDLSTGDPGASYETAYVDFVRRVRSRYPDAWIFLTIGSMLGEPNLGMIKGYLANVAATLNDPRLVTFDLGTQDMGWDGSVPTGCDWHPSAADHARMAEILKAQLKTRLGW